MGRIGTTVLDAISRLVLAVCIFGILAQTSASDAKAPRAQTVAGHRSRFPAPRSAVPEASIRAEYASYVGNESNSSAGIRGATVTAPAHRGADNHASARSHASAYTPPNLAQPSEFGSLLSRLLVATIGVLIACCLTLWLAKKYLVPSQAKAAASPDGALKLLASLRVSRRGCVQLVQVADTKIVVAIDGETLRSVIPLTETFGTTMLDAVENIDDLQPRRRKFGKN